MGDRDRHALHAVESLTRAARARSDPVPAAPDDSGSTSPPMTAGSLTAQSELGLTALLDGLTMTGESPAGPGS